MTKRLLMVAGLLALLVVGSNGYLHNWLGSERFIGSQASLIGLGSRVDIRAVQAWASVEAAKKLCGLEATDAADSMRRVNWKDNPIARRTMASVRKDSKAKGKEQFCKEVWAAYGPTGDTISGLVEKAGG